ncbi:hypothetical protein H7827_15840 [Streptomyces sp. JH002]|uniref:hypothetical protein n=1 Tax=Streptomyces sp. JH002 TaxID=2763259 RepID=UPI003D8040E4
MPVLLLVVVQERTRRGRLAVAGPGAVDSAWSKTVAECDVRMLQQCRSTAEQGWLRWSFGRSTG